MNFTFAVRIKITDTAAGNVVVDRLVVFEGCG